LLVNWVEPLDDADIGAGWPLERMWGDI